MTQRRGGTTRAPVGHRVSAAEESEWVQASERIALAASIQALFVLAARVAASEQGADPGEVSADSNLEALARVLPGALAPAIRAAADPIAVLSALGAPESAAPYLDQGWALAVGTNRQRLSAPGRVKVAAWQWRLRVVPVLTALQGTQEGLFEEKAITDPGDTRVLPVGDPDGDGAAPIRCAAEALRPGALRGAWQQLLAGAALLPPLDDLSELGQWVWHFDTFLSIFLQAIPAYWEGLDRPTRTYECTRDTLLDQSRIAGAIGVSLFRYHIRTNHHGPVRTEPEPPLLLISGEMSPIQDFIFGFNQSAGDADLILRGRSSFLRLVIDVAAYHLCAEMRLPPGSILLSAASKFTAIAPNTFECREIFKALQIEFDQWALDELHGQTGVRLAMKVMDPRQLENDHLEGTEWTIRRHNGGLLSVFSQLALRSEDSRYHQFQLCKRADEESASLKKQWKPPIYLKQRSPLNDAAAFQIALAKIIVNDNPMAVLTRRHQKPRVQKDPQALTIFGFELQVCTSRPSELPPVTGQMQWDLRSWSAESAASRWTGRCRRPLALYSRPDEGPDRDEPPTSRQLIKGDIDRLGIAFQRRIPGLNLSRIAGFSRQLEVFFSTLVPRQLSRQFPHLLTIYSGGDDFIFIGPTPDVMRFGIWLRREFGAFCNGRLTLSAGMSRPFRDAAASGQAVTEADDALTIAKETRDAVGFLDARFPWSDWATIADRVHAINRLVDDGALAQSVIVELAELIYRSRKQVPARSHLGVQIDDLLRKQSKRNVTAQMDRAVQRESGPFRSLAARARRAPIPPVHTSSSIAAMAHELLREWQRDRHGPSAPEAVDAMHETVERILTLRVHAGAMMSDAFKRLKEAICLDAEPEGIDRLLLPLTLVHAIRP